MGRLIIFCYDENVMQKIKKHLVEKRLTLAKNWKLFAVLGIILFLMSVGFTYLVNKNLLTEVKSAFNVL
jgi:hypothetical protein